MTGDLYITVNVVYLFIIWVMTIVLCYGAGWVMREFGGGVK